ncbi:unnamed protein product [Dicrocoelium dendriticum]|nr:unnamed protein product [Dicrocoelium dendriticum]
MSARQSIRQRSTPSGADSLNVSKEQTFGSAQSLARDMSKLVNRKLFSDVLFFVGPDREKLFAHKCILSARSEVFRQLFISEPMKASFDLSSVKPVTFLLLLYFLYTNSISFDKLDIYEVFDVMKAAEDYKCNELASLAETQLGCLIDPKTAFEFLPAAFTLKRDFLRTAALEYIEDYSASLLTPTNSDLLNLTAEAMKCILESDSLDLEEMRVVEVACFWAENFLQRARDCSAKLGGSQTRASVVNIVPLRDESPQVSSEITLTDLSHETEVPHSGSVTMQQAMEEVAMVMSCLRLALLTPNELAKLEEEQRRNRLIPQQCFINAWRQLAMNPNAIADGAEKQGMSASRKGTVSRLHRKKPLAESIKRTRSLIGRVND